MRADNNACQAFDNLELPRCRTSALSNFRVVELPGCRTSGLSNSRVVELPSTCPIRAILLDFYCLTHVLSVSIELRYYRLQCTHLSNTKYHPLQISNIKFILKGKLCLSKKTTDKRTINFSGNTSNKFSIRILGVFYFEAEIRKIRIIL